MAPAIKDRLRKNPLALILTNMSIKCMLSVLGGGAQSKRLETLGDPPRSTRRGPFRGEKGETRKKKCGLGVGGRGLVKDGVCPLIRGLRGPNHHEGCLVGVHEVTERVRKRGGAGSNPEGVGGPNKLGATYKEEEEGGLGEREGKTGRLNEKKGGGSLQRSRRDFRPGS